MLDRIVEGSIEIRQVALDPRGGAWFMFGPILKHIDAAGVVTTIRRPKDFTVLLDNANPQLATAPDGTLWVLGRTSLAEVRSGAASAKVIPFGPLPDNGFGPAERVQHSPAALAVDGAGHVAIGLDGTSVVRVYDSADGAFNDVQLPRATDALSLRYFHDGRLAIGLGFHSGGRPNRAVIANTDGSLSRLIDVGDSTLVNPYSDTAVLFGGIHMTMLRSDGNTRTIVLPNGIRPVPELGGVQVGRNGTLVVPTATGITFLTGTAHPVATSTYAYRIGNQPCGPLSPIGPTGPTGPTRAGGTSPPPPPNEACLVPPRVAVADDGGVWVFNTLVARAGTRLIIERLDPV